MIEFNKIQKKSGLGNSQTKKVEEKTKVEQKSIEASSSKALNSYGRAFVNLSFKGKIENNGTNATKETSTNETEALTKEEQEEIIEEIRKFYQDKGYSDDNIDYNIKTFISDDENIRNKQLYAYKKLKEDGAQTIAAVVLATLYQTDKDNTEAKIDFAKQLNAQGYDLSKIARLLYIEEYDKPTDSKKINEELAFVKKLLDDDSFKDEEKETIIRFAREHGVYDKSIIELSKKTKNITPRYSSFSYDLLEGLYSPDKQIQEQQMAFAKELIESDYWYTAGILSETKTDDKQTTQELISFAKELIKSESYNGYDIKGILSETKTDDRQTTQELISFAKELIKNESYSGYNIKDILSKTKTDDRQTTQELISFAKELIKNESYSHYDIKDILSDVKSNNKQTTQQQIAFAKELIESKGYNVAISEILDGTRNDDEQITQQQIAFAKELIESKSYNLYDIVKILGETIAYDGQTTQQQIAFAKELIESKSYDPYDIATILDETIAYDGQTTQQVIDLAKELAMGKNYNAEDIAKILRRAIANDKGVAQLQIAFAKELTQDKNYNTDDIDKILITTESGSEQTTRELIAFAKELLQDKSCSTSDIAGILNTIISNNEEICQQQIAFAKELLENEYNTNDIANILNSLYSSFGEDISLNIKNAKKILATINEDDELTKEQAVAILTSKDTISAEDIKKLQKRMGYKNAARLNSADIIFAAKLVGLYNITDVNQIPIEDKKDVIRNLVECNNGCFEISDQLKQFFPLIPTNQEEYCTLLPSLVKALGIETKELKESEIKEFNSSLNNLRENLSKLSDEDFSNLQISQEYSSEDFIKDVFDIIKDLPTTERQKVYDYFGFELHKNPNGAKVNDKLNFSIVGYPANLNNGKKLAKIEDTKTKEVVEKLRPYVIKYSENNKISTNDDNVTNAINSIIKYLPEFRTSIDKTQHNTHDFTVANHSLKVMQKIVQNPEFKNLNDSDKKLMLLSALLHDLSKTEGKKDVLHATNSAFDAYYISKKFNLTRDEEIKLYSLIKNHEWLGYVNAKDLTSAEKLHRQQSVAFDLQYDNLFDMSKIFTKADLESVKKDDEFYDKFKSEFEANSSKIDSLISELKTSQPLFPVTKIPSASRINKAITTVNPNGSTNLKGIYKDENGLVIIRFNEVENSTWEKIGFDKGSISKGITTTTSAGDEVDTGNIHFFVHGLDYENQLSKFDAFSLPDSDALLSVSYVERPESKTRFFRSQGVILDTETKYTYGGGETDSGSGCGKNIDNFKNDYVFGGNRETDRKYISNLIKTTLELDDKEYLDFVQKNKNKSFGEIEPAEVREKLIKAFAGINSNTRRGNRAYNEMYISNPNVMGVFAYPIDRDDKIGDTMKFVKEHGGFLQKYAIEHDVPMIVFGK